MQLKRLILKDKFLFLHLFGLFRNYVQAQTTNEPNWLWQLVCFLFLLARLFDNKFFLFHVLIGLKFHNKRGEEW